MLEFQPCQDFVVYYTIIQNKARGIPNLLPALGHLVTAMGTQLWRKIWTFPLECLSETNTPSG